MSRKVFMFGFILFGMVICISFSSNKVTFLSIHNFKSTKVSAASAIAGFYHFSTIRNHWKIIVLEQLKLANHSGLIRASSNIYVTGLGPLVDNGTVSSIFSNPKYIYEYVHNHTELYEFPTLKKLESFCLDNNQSFVWYAHSKGASRPFDLVATWRNLLNHFVLDKWQMCYELLSSTNYTTCGSILTLDSMRKPQWNTYYAGNMWWAKCSHVNRLTRIKHIDQSDRYMAELYITSEPAIGHFNCYNTALTNINPSDYKHANCLVNQPLWKVR